MASAISPLKNFGQIEAGGFYLEHGLPDEYYAFTDGEISLTAERGGGINTIAILDIFKHNGKLYPDRCPTPYIISQLDLLIHLLLKLSI